MSNTADPISTAQALRRGVLGLAALGVIGAVIELATLRHWDSAVQLIPWVALAVLGVLVVALAVRPSALVIRGARSGGAVALVASLFGMWEHVSSNMEAGVLDRVWGASWDNLSWFSRVWHSMNGDVGPSPLLAPGVIAQIGLCLVLATIGARAADH